ncbi:hypothetical protein [Synechococcus sp. O70.2]|uniref:hypothetical protein n=1 Tax=Synechococcus sp. O70.2 TaxID=2964533 RepID=UPI0039C2AFC0
MTPESFLEESVQSFFARLNWDNRPRQSRLLPMPFLRVREYLNSIPWPGDPLALAARSWQSLGSVPEAGPEEEQITLDDLLACFER